VGRVAVWCCLYAVLAEFAMVLMRYAFGIGSIKLQESVLYAHAGLFMLAAAWTLQIGVTCGWMCSMPRRGRARGR
jgi:TRAP-type mannitol/chloroaromatic compound transport system permease small subunit